MYEVSDAYKKSMKEPVQRFKIGGTVAVTPFTDINVLKGSFSITNQCSDDTEMKIGQVYVGELNATFLIFLLRDMLIRISSLNQHSEECSKVEATRISLWECLKSPKQTGHHPV